MSQLLYHPSLTKKDKVREEIKYSEQRHQLMLGHCCLLEFPIEILTFESTHKFIIRLDLSNNCIKNIPALTCLANLKELWLQHNPLETLPPDIHMIKSLELIDIRDTLIDDVPKELALLKQLYSIDWRGTPLAKVLLEKYSIQINDFVSLRELLIDENTRKQLEIELFEFLQGDHFLQDAGTTPNLDSLISALVKEISAAFDDLLFLKQYVRRAGKFLPEKIAMIEPGVSVAKSLELFYEFKRDTDRKRLAADVEIKLRGMYFDRIERSTVTEVLDSIYEYVNSLEDIQFLIQYATQVLPQNVEEASGALIWDNILQLQTDLTNKRKASVASLAKAMGQLYPEQKPELIKEKAELVAKSFQIERFATKKELEKMSQLTAECAKVFPPDFANIGDGSEVLAAAKAVIFQKT